MKKADFFREAMKAQMFKRKPWLISAFSVIREDADAYLKDPYLYRIVQMPTGMFFLSFNDVLIKIDDALPNEPIFKFTDAIEVDETICENLTGSIQTYIGQVLFNLIVIVKAFGNRFPYVTGRVNINKLEDQIAIKLRDTPDDEKNRDPNYFYVDEYVTFTNALSFVAGLTQLCVWAATEKNVTAPPGLKAFKQQLLEKYAGKLNNPVELANFEKELQTFDEAYLKDDPSNGKFISGKMKDNARKKMFLTMGNASGFEDSLDTTPIVNSLEEGWPKDATQFAAMMNNSRSGSYSRGKETQKGGVSFKTLLRAAGNLKILPEDCGTKLGIHRTLKASDIKQLIGRAIQTSKSWQVIHSEEEAQPFINQAIIVRSPMYCKLDGDALCAQCAGEKLAQNPDGIAMALTNISSIVMTTSLKQMHGVVLSTAKLDIETSFT